MTQRLSESPVRKWQNMKEQQSQMEESSFKEHVYAYYVLSPVGKTKINKASSAPGKKGKAGKDGRENR